MCVDHPVLRNGKKLNQYHTAMKNSLCPDAGLKDTETKAYLRGRILGEPILMKGCATSIIIHFNSVLVFSCAESCDQQSRFLILIGSKIIQHNKRKVGSKFRK